MIIKTIKIKDGFILRELGGEFCLVYQDDSNNGSLDGLPSINETGIFLWDRLEKGYSPSELITALTEKQQIDFEDAEADVGEFLAKLINGKVVDYTK